MIRRPRHNLALALGSICLVLAGACATAAPPSPVAAPSQAVTSATSSSPAENAPATPTALLWVATAPEYLGSVYQTYWSAQQRLGDLSRGYEAGQWGVILDVDETVLSNVQYEIESLRLGRTFEEVSWNEWCRREEAKALPGVVPFLERVRGLGGRIALVTNRGNVVEDATSANLRAEGVPFDILLTKVSESDKTTRLEAVRNGTAHPDFGPIEVVLYFGDQVGDFPWTQSDDDDRATSPSTFDATGGLEFGKRFVLLPNPLYGKWQRHTLP